MEGLLSQIKCVKCNRHSLQPFDMDLEYTYGLSSISCDQCELVCLDCLIYYMYCPECLKLVKDDNFDYSNDHTDLDLKCSYFKLMKFLGHDIECRNKECDECNRCENCLSRRGIFKYSDSKEIKIEVIYIDKEYMDPKFIVNGEKNIVSGDDGGKPHYWFCDKCNDVYDFIDK